MQRKLEAIRRRFCHLPQLAIMLPVAAALAALVIAGIVGLAHSFNYVTVTDTGGARHVLLTTAEAPEAIVAEAGLRTSSHDEIVYEEDDSGTAEVLIRRAFPVTIAADGERITAQFVEGTVADLVQESEVQLGPEDFVEPAADTPLEKNLQVEVMRVSYTEEVRREELPDEVVEGWAESLPEDAGFVKSYNGSYDVTYRDRLVNGEVESSEMIEVVPLVAPRPADSYEFIEGVPCSRIEGYDDIEFGADGLPLGYTHMWEGAVSTAYSSSGGRGSSGLGLYCGTAAVNPNRIPYGTRMYITSADGKFVYGFCIATDTGTALMDGRVDIDLYFETNAECYQFGKRGLNIYFFGPEPAEEEPAA